jgi:hypothetical protein
MSRHPTSASFALDLCGLIEVEDVPCEFEVEVEVCHLEPYSWGESRGTETEITAILNSVKLGGLALNRDQALLAFGEDAIERAENAAEDRIAEEWRER